MLVEVGFFNFVCFKLLAVDIYVVFFSKCRKLVGVLEMLNVDKIRFFENNFIG